MKKLNLAVFVSGSGTNLQAIIDACKNSSYPAQISCVISNKKDAYALVRAKENGVETYIVPHNKFPSRELFEAELNNILEKYDIDLICLAGFMRILSPYFITKWENKIINIHPSLLPLFKGLHPQKQALEAGAKVSGCTVHYVNNELDGGEIILQHEVPIIEGETEESLSKKILEKEHIAYAQAIRKIAENL